MTTDELQAKCDQAIAAMDYRDMDTYANADYWCTLLVERNLNILLGHDPN
jgi:hypothetical protein